MPDWNDLDRAIKTCADSQTGRTQMREERAWVKVSCIFPLQQALQ
jgi:hypothetical protein